LFNWCYQCPLLTRCIPLHLATWLCVPLVPVQSVCARESPWFPNTHLCSLSISLSLSLTDTHTHTHQHTGKYSSSYYQCFLVEFSHTSKSEKNTSSVISKRIRLFPSFASVIQACELLSKIMRYPDKKSSENCS